MIEVIIGITMSVITQIVKKTEVDAKIIILGLSILFGTIYYFFKETQPELLETVTKQILGAYGISQIVYNYGISLWEKKKEDLDPKKKEN